MQKILIPVLMTAVVVGGGGFFAGSQFGGGAAAETPQQQGQFQRGDFSGQRGQFGGQRPDGTTIVSGSVLNVSDNTLTVELTDGGSQLVLVGDSTEISRQTEGSLEDLAPGTNIFITGEERDGTVTAQMIQIRPEGFEGFGGRPATRGLED